MSEQNIEIVREVVEACNRGDVAAALELADPGIEVWEDPAWPGAEVHHGVEGFLASVAKRAEAFGGMRFACEEFVDLGDRVLVVLRIDGQDGQSVAPVDRRFGQIWTIRSGRVVRWEWFVTLGSALEAVGLREMPPQGAEQYIASTEAPGSQRFEPQRR